MTNFSYVPYWQKSEREECHLTDYEKQVIDSRGSHGLVDLMNQWPAEYVREVVEWYKLWRREVEDEYPPFEAIMMLYLTIRPKARRSMKADDKRQKRNERILAFGRDWWRRSSTKHVTKLDAALRDEFNLSWREARQWRENVLTPRKIDEQLKVDVEGDNVVSLDTLRGKQ